MSHLQRYDGFLYQRHDTANGHVLTNPGQGNCAESTPTSDHCFFVSNVGNGCTPRALIVVREAMPGPRHLADGLIAPMNFGISYDNRAETHCNTNPGEHSSVEVYRLSRAGIDQADRL